MGISDKSKFPSFKANLEVDVRALFGLLPEKVVPQPKPQVSVAELAQQKVQAEFAKVATLHGPAQEQARRNFIDSLQVYNAATGAHQESQIAALESPFISTPELIRQSPFIQTAMQRDVILNARDQAHKLTSDTEDLWGTSKQNDRELHIQFEEVVQQLSGALAQFDAGDADAAFASYRRVLSENEAHMDWMARDMRHSEQLKKGAVVGITAVAGAAAVIATDGVALAALGPDGVAALSGGARLGLLLGNGAAFISAQRTLEQKILHIPFWRKSNVAANAMDFGIDVARTSALMGTLKVVGEGAALAMPIAKAEPALIAMRNFGAELSGFNGFDIATGSNPREIFTLHHQLDQFAFLLGLRAANGVIGGIPSMMKGAAAIYDRITESPRLARLALLPLAPLGLFGVLGGGGGGKPKSPDQPSELVTLTERSGLFAPESQLRLSRLTDLAQTGAENALLLMQRTTESYSWRLSRVLGSFIGGAALTYLYNPTVGAALTGGILSWFGVVSTNSTFNLVLEGISRTLGDYMRSQGKVSHALRLTEVADISDSYHLNYVYMFAHLAELNASVARHYDALRHLDGLRSWLMQNNIEVWMKRDVDFVTSTYRRLGQSLMRTGQFGRAADMYAEAAKLHREHSTDVRAKFFERLQQLAADRSSQFDGFVSPVELALIADPKIGALLIQARDAIAAGDLQGAMPYLHAASELSESSHNVLGEEMALTLMGFVTESINDQTRSPGRPNSASEALQKSEEIVSQQLASLKKLEANRTGAARVEAQVAQAELFARLGYYGEAQRVLLKVEHSCSETMAKEPESVSKHMRATIAQSLGYLALELSDFPTAVIKLQSALRQFEELHDVESAEHTRQLWQIALDREGVRTPDVVQDVTPLHLNFAHERMARAMEQEGRGLHEAAIGEYWGAFEAFEAAHDADGMMESMKCLEETYKIMGHHDRELAVIRHMLRMIVKLP